MKTCTSCRETKALGDFSPHPRNNDGRQSHCKSCLASAARERREQENDRVRFLESEVRRLKQKLIRCKCDG